MHHHQTTKKRRTWRTLCTRSSSKNAATRPSRCSCLHQPAIKTPCKHRAHRTPTLPPSDPAPPGPSNSARRRWLACTGAPSHMRPWPLRPGPTAGCPRHVPACVPAANPPANRAEALPRRRRHGQCSSPEICCRCPQPLPDLVSGWAGFQCIYGCMMVHHRIALLRGLCYVELPV